MHIVEIFPGRAKCSCGKDFSKLTTSEAAKAAREHSLEFRPSMVVDRRLCSAKCREGIPGRDVVVKQHDDTCPQNNT